MIAQAWHTANFAGGVFGGQLKPLETYIGHKGQKGKPVSREEFLQHQRAQWLLIAETNGMKIRFKES